MINIKDPKEIFNRIEHMGFETRINPKEIAKGIYTYDRVHFYCHKIASGKRDWYYGNGDPLLEHENNKDYFKIKKDELGKQYIDLLFADSGGYDTASFRLYFEDDQDLLNFMRR